VGVPQCVYPVLVDGHLDYFQFLATMNNIYVHGYISLLWSKYLEVKLLDHKIGKHLAVLEISSFPK
jgi:hypothetical protein